jgi:demethylspheroidene O-methyltransferase
VALPSFLLRLRNSLLSDPKFLAFAQRFPLTRHIARRKSIDLFGLLAGFAYSQVLYACVKLGVLEHIGSAGLSIEALAEKLKLTKEGTTVLVRAAVALDILNEDKERIVLGPHGAAMIGQPWIMRFVEHHRHFYRDLEDPVALLNGQSAIGGLRSYWNYEDATADKSEYSELMAASQQAVSQQILGAYDFGRHRNLLDVGGGSGAFLRAVGARYPHLSLHLYDLPGVMPLAHGNFTRQGGDFRSDALPKDMDIISLVRVIHDHDDAAVLALLRNVRRACAPETVVLIAEPFSGNKATAAVTDAYFGLYFAAMGQGRTRTPQEITALAGSSGFTQAKVWPTNMPLITGMMTFRPKAQEP